MAKKLNVKVKPIGLLDLIAFTKLVPNRTKRFSSAPDNPINPNPAMNRLAALMHPKEQVMVIKEIVEEAPKVKTYMLAMNNGKQPAYFRAGQYISVKAQVNEAKITRPYSLSSSPKQSLEGIYTLTIKESDEGFFSKWVMDNWNVNDEVIVSGPEGTFYYEPIRDAKTVIGICGGSGVTPFYSLAKAIVDGTEDFNLILLYGSCKECDVLFKKEFKELEKASGGKVKIVYVLSDEKKKGYEEGFITEDIILKYAPKDSYSVFICGPQVMYDFVSKELESLKLARKFIRRELFGEIKMIDKAKGYPKKAFGKVFKLTVNTYSDNTVIDARADESVLVALERAGIAAPSKCRSGECGYCRSKLITGDVFTPQDNDARRESDKKFGYIHLCSAYPISDLTIEVPPPQS